MIDLYEYQKEDVEKATNLRAALIGSDMGTGKTHEAIEIANKWRMQVLGTTKYWLPILVIVPVNVFESWQEKYANQCPELKVKVIDRKNRNGFINDILDFEYDVYIANWDSVRLIVDKLSKHKIMFSVVIGDEVHRISNRKSQVTEFTKRIRTYRKLGLSGTASGGQPWGIWSVLNWLYPLKYSSFWKFVDDYIDAELSDAGEYTELLGAKNVEQFQKEIEPFYIRHSKKGACCPHHPNGVMSWLPEKNYETLYVDLNPEQRRIYNEMFEEMVAWVNENKDTPLVAQIAASKLVRLMQITLATPVVSNSTRNRRITNDDGTTEKVVVDIELVDLKMPSPKIDLAKELILEQDDESFVVFTASKKGAELAVNEFLKAGITTGLISGDVPVSERFDLISKFRNKEVRVIVGVIRAIAEGIDGLQDVCNTAIFLNRDLSPIKNPQAEDRLYRGGQHRNVTIIDIIARDTIDTERLDKLNDSWGAIRALLGIK